MILEGITKIMKKVADKINAITQQSFQSSHKDRFFKAQSYAQEKEGYFFKALVRQVGASPQPRTPGLEDEEFLYRLEVPVQQD